MLFKDEYPGEYRYFKTALEKEIPSIEETDYREELTKVLTQLETVTVTHKCMCGEAGCWTFDFADRGIVGYSESIPLIETSVVASVDLDANGNLVGVELAPD
jgi:hypothetical protein